eukprot:6200133-Pleurochrysis_carterae.AAC.1
MSRAGCDGVYKSLVCDRRVKLASAHDAQDGAAACRRLWGASVVYSASRFRLAPPQCSRRGAGCMYCQRATRSLQIVATEDVPFEEAAAADEWQK